MNNYMKSIGKESAIKLGKTEWWKACTPEQIVSAQLFISELCMDFGDFHLALEKCLGRPVWTHEFGLNYNGIVEEFLGKKEAPSIQEIMEMIPAEKRVVISI